MIPSNHMSISTSANNTKRVSKRPSSKLLEQIKSKQSQLRNNESFEQNPDELLDQIPEEKSEAYQYHTKTKEFFYKVNSDDKWNILRASNYNQLIKEMKLIIQDQEIISIKSQRSGLVIENDESFEKLRDNGEMILIQSK